MFVNFISPCGQFVQNELNSAAKTQKRNKKNSKKKPQKMLKMMMMMRNTQLSFKQLK